MCQHSMTSCCGCACLGMRAHAQDPFAPTAGRAAADKLNRAVLLCHRAAAPLVCIEWPRVHVSCGVSTLPCRLARCSVCRCRGRARAALLHHTVGVGTPQPTMSWSSAELSHTVVSAAGCGCAQTSNPPRWHGACRTVLHSHARVQSAATRQQSCRCCSSLRATVCGVVGLCCGRRWQAALHSVCAEYRVRVVRASTGLSSYLACGHRGGFCRPLLDRLLRRCVAGCGLGVSDRLTD